MIYISYQIPNPDNYSMENFSDDDNLDNFSDQTRLDYIDYVQALQVCESLLIILIHFDQATGGLKAQGRQRVVFQIDFLFSNSSIYL